MSDKGQAVVVERNRCSKRLVNSWVFDSRAEAQAFVKARKAEGLAGTGTDYSLSIKDVTRS